MNPQKKKHTDWHRILFIVLLSLGIVLRCYQYFMGRSLWEDETHLALNLIKRDFLHLLKPLDFIQGAPVLFLIITKTINTLFGYNELAFRFLPFVMSILTLPLFYYFLFNLFNNKYIAISGLLLLAVNSSLIYYSSEFKPYGVDVAVYILLAWLITTKNEFVKRYKTPLFLFAGGFSLTVSISAFIVLFCLTLVMVIGWVKEKKIIKQEFFILLGWGAVFCLNYLLFIHNHPSTALQRDNFSSGFCPTDLSGKEFKDFVSTTTNDVFFEYMLMLPREFGNFLPLIFLLSLIHIIRSKNYRALVMLCLPLILHLALSVLKIYPFVYRLILYQTPLLITLTVLGIYVFFQFLYEKINPATGIVAGCLALSFLCIKPLGDFPRWNREIKPAIQFANDNLPPNSHIYIFDPIHAYDYYYYRKIANTPVYKGLDWEIKPREFYIITSRERNPYLLFCNSANNVGYRDVLTDLKAKNLVWKTFVYKGFETLLVYPHSKNLNDSILLTLDYTYFDSTMIFSEQKLIALWNNAPITTKPVPLKKGDYKITLTTKGDPAENQFPHINVFVNDSLRGDFYNEANYHYPSVSFKLTHDQTVIFKIQMDNDKQSGKEDRNSFLLFADIKKINMD